MMLTQCLSIQHQVFLDLLDYVEELKKSGKTAGLKETVFGIAKVVEKHGTVEEKYLFPELRPFLGDQMGPVAVMEFEHKELKRILESLDQVQEDREILATTGKFIAYLRDHIEKEEKVLFPSAEDRLGKDKLESLAAKANC